MSPGLNLRALEVFVAVAETRTMTLAAERLQAAPSTVSQQIATLEETLATRLIDRTTRPLSLTTAGQRFLIHARRILDNVSAARSEMMSLRLASLPSLKFAIIDDFDTSLTSALMVDVRERYPDCFLSAWTGRSDSHLRALLDREVDIIVTTDGADRAHLGDYLQILERHPLLQEPLIIVAAPQAVRQDRSLARLRSMPFVRYSFRMSLGRIIEAQLRRLRLEPAPVYEFDSSHALFATVQQCGGWALTTPACVLESPALCGALTVFAPPFANTGRTVSLWARHRELADLPQQLADVCRDILRRSCIAAGLQRMPWLADTGSFQVLSDDQD